MISKKKKKKKILQKKGATISGATKRGRKDKWRKETKKWIIIEIKVTFRFKTQKLKLNTFPVKKSSNKKTNKKLKYK